ncbi:MAG: hypothetical protein ABJA82_00545 [Myxococcales bacterium]
MANENGNGAGDGADFDDPKEFDANRAERAGAITQRTDFARLIGVRLGLSVTEVGNRISETFRKLREVSPARRRAILEGAIYELDEVVDTLSGAKDLIREQVRLAYLEKDADK